MRKTTLKDIKILIQEGKNTQGENNASNPTIKSSSTSLFPTFSNYADNKACIKRKNSHHPVTKREPSITQEKEVLLKKYEGMFTIKELSNKLNISPSALYYWTKKNHYQAKNGNSCTPISKELGKIISQQLSMMSTADLAREHHLPYHVLYYWINKQGLHAKKTSVFPEYIQRELREKCRIFSLKDLAHNYGLSEQTMRSRLKNIGCFSDGQGGFLIIDERIGKEIKSFYCENGICKTAEQFHTTKIAIKSYLKSYDNKF